jgi:DNA replication protein DnaC
MISKSSFASRHHPMTTMAAVDRLIHHSTILEFDWDSIRAMEAKKRKQ